MAQPAEAPHPGETAVEGRIDAVERGRIYGWAWDPSRPDDRLEIQVWAGDRHLGSTEASIERRDLAANGVGDGRHAFQLALPAGEAVPGDIKVYARAPDTGQLVALVHRDAPAAQPEAALAVPLRRIAEAIEQLRQSQRQFHAVQQSAVQAMRKASQEGQDLAVEKTLGIRQALDEIVAAQQGLEQQIAALEVFHLRFDEVLREFDKKLLAERGGPDRPLRRIVAFIGLVSAAALVVAVVALLGGLGALGLGG